MDTEYSKRVYQGVRVKHTVKDLLAEKRSQQTSGPRYSVTGLLKSISAACGQEPWYTLNGTPAHHKGGSTTPPSFVPMPGSHMLPGYYGMRRPLISDTDFCSSTKQFSPDVYSSTLGSKPLGCDPSTVTGYSSLIDSYYPETFGDYRSAAAFSNSGGSFLSPSTLSSLLPPFGGEASHLFLRDSWEQSVPDTTSQEEALCPDGLASVSIPPPMPSPGTPGSPSQYRSPSRGASMGPGSQPYTLHTLEDTHYHPLTTSSSYPVQSTSFPCPPYMSSPVSELVSKIVTEEVADSHPSLAPSGEGHSCWPKEDGGNPWSSYEIRRAY